MKSVIVRGFIGAACVSGFTFAGVIAACGSSNNDSTFDGGAGYDSSVHSTTGNDGSSADDDGGFGDDGPSITVPDSAPTPTCKGLECAIATTCGTPNGTTITGKIMDPSGANPLPNVLAYVPMYDPANPSAIPAGAAIEPITGGVNFPSGVSCDSCSYLYSGNPISVATSGADGTFTLTNVPSGTNVPIVIQVGKWRAHTTVAKVTDCMAATSPNIKLPSKADGSDPIDSIPQIAISMGIFDSLECLPYRLGIDPSEFTSGASTTGHIHVFTGGGNGGKNGSPPESSGALWDNLADMQKYDVTLLSCEGAETTAANPQLLEQYVNTGGRAFLSHYHYSWLTGPLIKGAAAGYTSPADWGSHLATWNPADAHGAVDNKIVGASINTTLNVDGGVFAKGVEMKAWLGNVGALGTDGVDAGDVAIVSPAFDPSVTSANTISQAYATYEPNQYNTTYPTAYFTFNTPVNAMATTDGGAAPYCGRIVYSGLHVGAAAHDTTGGVKMPTSTTCNPAPGNLSPQEKVLEYALFDLSSCVTPDTAPPGTPPITVIR